MIKLAIMVSGNLGFQALKSVSTTHEVVAVFTDKGSVSIIDYAKTENLECFVGNPRNGKAESFISNKEIDVLLSVNYLFLIEDDLIHWPNKAAVNLHGSLLPKYRGRTPHVWAIINNEKQTGVTAHLISKGCDEGGVLKQKVIAINPEDTGADILEKYEKVYPELISEVISDIDSGVLRPVKQDESKATYFGKRTPKDGEINWNWQKERIRNWVRAQAAPYPGAYTWIEGRKLVIDKVVEDDLGFLQSFENGLILTENPLRVKTPNGVLKIEKVRDELKLNLKGKKFTTNENS